MNWGKAWVWEGQDQSQGGHLGVVVVQARCDGSLNSGHDAGGGKKSTKALRI